MNEKQIEPHEGLQDGADQLQAELRLERQLLAEAEAALAEEQAAVNAFRMHARLKLDDLVDQLLELRAQKQMLLTKLALLRQQSEFQEDLDDDPLLGAAWHEHGMAEEDETDLLLPTPTPRDKRAEKALYRELARRFHPDYATSAVERSYRTMMMAAVNEAYTAENVDALYDLAGELSPEQAAQLTRISNRQTRALRRSISKMRRLRNKARRQLTSLRADNTARLWQRAVALEDCDEDWWSELRRDLEKAVALRQDQVTDLTGQLEELTLVLAQDDDDLLSD